jgi:hypothetical protein
VGSTAINNLFYLPDRTTGKLCVYILDIFFYTHVAQVNHSVTHLVSMGDSTEYLTSGEIMSKRLNISVSDELALRMEPLKGEFNVSKVCANAIDKEVTMQENIQSAFGEGEYSEVISRLRRDLEERNQRSRELLSSDVYDFGKKLVETEELSVIEMIAEDGIQGFRDELEQIGGLDNYDLRSYLEDPLPQDERNQRISDLAAAFRLCDEIMDLFESWPDQSNHEEFEDSLHAGVMSVWKKIKPAVYGDVPPSSPSTEEE